MKFDYANPYPSTRIPVFARNVVSTSHPLAAQAGLRILQQGGNAVDAAIATAAVMTLVEPVSNGLGSDAFCILWDGKKLHGLNASGCAPAGLDARLLPQQVRRRRRHAADARHRLGHGAGRGAAAGSRCASASASCPSPT